MITVMSLGGGGRSGSGTRSTSYVDFLCDIPLGSAEDGNSAEARSAISLKLEASMSQEPEKGQI